MEKVQALTVKHRIRKRLHELPLLIGEYATWLERTKKPQTVLEYVKDVGLFSDYLKEREHQRNAPFGQKTFEALQRTDVEEFLFTYLPKHEKVYTRLNGKEVHQTFNNHQNSQRRKLSALRSFSRFLLLEAKLVTLDITHGIEIGRVKERTVPFLTKAKQTALLDAMEQFSEDEFQKVRNQFITFLFLKVGLKTGELLELDIQDVDIEKERIRIQRNELDDPIYMDIQKIPKSVSHRYIELREEKHILMGWHHDALFLSIQNKRLNRRTIHYIFQRYESFLESNDKLTPQLLRNTFVMETPLKKEDVKKVARQLGTRDIYATIRTYPVLKKKKNKNK